jgi:hypothetical protein
MTLRLSSTALAIALSATAGAQGRPALAPWTCANRPEADFLKQAPLPGTRPAKDQLVVAWAKGFLAFRDSGVVAGDEGGTTYTYCGFRNGFHLVQKAAEELYSGLLVVHSTGQILPGGHTVFVSPSNTLYLALSQPHGQDGETWTVRSTSGSVLWDGYAGLIGTVGQLTGMVLGELEDPHWTADGKLRATFMCKGKRSAVTLVRAADGRWDWSPQMKCIHQP